MSQVFVSAHLKLQKSTDDAPAPIFKYQEIQSRLVTTTKNIQFNIGLIRDIVTSHDQAPKHRTSISKKCEQAKRIKNL